MSHFIRRQDIFYFNKRLPQSLSEKRPLVRFSLQTKDRRIARYLSAVLVFKLDAYLEDNPKSDKKYLTSKCRSWLSKSATPLSHETGTHSQPHPPTPQQTLEPKGNKNKELGKKLSCCFQLFEKENLNAGTWSIKTHADVLGAFQAMTEIVGDIGINTFTGETARTYKETLMRYPKQRTVIGHLKNKSLKELLKQPESYTSISPVTVNNQLRKTRTFFNWCVANKYIESNPISGMKVIEKKGKEARLSFSPEDLKLLFTADLFINTQPEKPWQYWVPLIARLSGCRMEEVCQLYLEDIIHHNGIPCFKITDEREDQKLKNASSRRLVPVHEQLLSFGLLEHIKQLREHNHTRLFPELKAVRGQYGHEPSKWFTRYRRKHGVSQERKSFHSFRHTVIDELRDIGVSDSVTKLIVGHSDDSMTFGHYGSRLPVKQMKEAIDKLAVTGA